MDWAAALKKLVGATPREADGHWVPGGSLIYIPSNRLNEIPSVIEEHSREEFKRVRWLHWAKRF